MSHAQRIRTRRTIGVAVRAGSLLLTVLGVCCSSADAQQPPLHYLHAGAFPPGAIGTAQTMQRAPLAGYFQPVEIRAPQGAKISLAVENQFMPGEAAPVRAGMLIGAVYRLKVTDIPENLGLEIFPTIEVVDRLYPPAGMEARFAVPVELSQEELVFALQGKFVTRVIYLENPDVAYPVADNPKQQIVYEVGPQEKPVEVADRLGRPMAILRIGGRTPDDRTGPDATFMYNSPPLTRYFSPPAADVAPVKVEALQQKAGGVKTTNTRGQVQR